MGFGYECLEYVELREIEWLYYLLIISFQLSQLFEESLVLMRFDLETRLITPVISLMVIFYQNAWLRNG